MYKITLTENQVWILGEALEVYARLGIGQFRNALDYLPLNGNCNREDWYNGLEAIGKILSENMKYNIDGLRTNLSMGNKETAEEAKIAWEIHQVLRKRISWDRAVKDGIIPSIDSPRKWPEMFGVCYDDPMRISKEPFATIERDEK